jgi:microcystin-dependent protein
MEALVGEIRMFAGDYAPLGWLPCNGSFISALEYEMLYAKIGNTYGEGPDSTFALPDLQGRVPLHVGSVTGGNPIVLGQYGGTEMVSLQESNIPPHAHEVAAEFNQATETVPGPNSRLAISSENAYVHATGDIAPILRPMNALSISRSEGGNKPVSVVQPFLAITFMIAYEGIF